MIESMLRGSRCLVLAAVFGAVAGAFALFNYGFVRTMMIVWQALASADLSSKAAHQSSMPSCRSRCSTSSAA